MEGKETQQFQPQQDKNICGECGVELNDRWESAALYECEHCAGANED